MVLIHTLKTEKDINTIRFNIKICFSKVKMEFSLTKISQNGQVVIPSEIRKEAEIEPTTKFLVFNVGGNILLKRLTEDALRSDIILLEKIEKSEKQIKEGRSIKAKTTMREEAIDKLLTK